MEEKKIIKISIDKDIYIGEGYKEKNSQNFIKEGKGLYYKNYDKINENQFYFGEWINNKRVGRFYLKNENNDALFGNFNINGDGKGIYFWFDQNNNEYNKFYLGEFSEEKISKGFLLNKEIISNNNKLNGNIYYGNFNNEGKKNDKNGIFFDLEKNLMFYGEIKNDEVISGLEVGFDLNNNIICAGIDLSSESKLDKIYFENALPDYIRNGVKQIFLKFYNNYIQNNIISNLIQKIGNFVNELKIYNLNIPSEEQLQLIDNFILLIPEFFDEELPTYILPVFKE